MVLLARWFIVSCGGSDEGWIHWKLSTLKWKTAYNDSFKWMMEHLNTWQPTGFHGVNSHTQWEQAAAISFYDDVFIILAV